MISNTETLTKTFKSRQSKTKESFWERHSRRLYLFFANGSAKQDYESDLPDDWVPADRRIGGFDKKTIWPGVAALIIWAIWAHGLPFINSQIAFDRPIKEGDVVNLSRGELTFTPAVGWNLEDGILMTDETIRDVSKGSTRVVSEGGITLEVKTANFNGTSEELLDQVLETSDVVGSILLKDVSDRITFTNDDGVTGSLATFKGSEEQGAVVTYVFETGSAAGPIGVEATLLVSEDAEAVESDAEDIAKMLTSIRYMPSSEAQ